MLFFLLISVEFVLMLTVSEPFPAVILPPFQSTSDKERLQASHYEVVTYGPGTFQTSIDYRDIFDFAPPITALFMLMRLPEQSPSTNNTGNPGSWKEIIRSSREKVIERSNNAYSEAIRWLGNKVENEVRMSIDSLVVKRESISANWQEKKIDTVLQDSKTYIFLSEEKQE
jgi:hypothetical protein